MSGLTTVLLPKRCTGFFKSTAHDKGLPAKLNSIANVSIQKAIDLFGNDCCVNLHVQRLLYVRLCFYFFLLIIFIPISSPRPISRKVQMLVNATKNQIKLSHPFLKPFLNF